MHTVSAEKDRSDFSLILVGPVTTLAPGGILTERLRWSERQCLDTLVSVEFATI